MVRDRERPKLGEILTGSGRLTPAQLGEALDGGNGADRAGDRGGDRLGERLVRLGHLSEDSLLHALAEQLGLEMVDLVRVEVAREVRSILPVEFVRDRHVLPIALRHGRLVVATADPRNERVREDIRLLTALEVEEVLAPRRAIAQKIAECYEVTVEQLVEGIEGDGEGGTGGGDNLHDIRVMASEPTVVNLVNVILAKAIRERASDVHLVPFESSLELRYRVDGMLRLLPPPPKHLQAAIVSRIKIMADMNIAERFLPQDGHIQIQHDGRRVDIRVGSMPTIYGESLVLRLLEKDGNVQSLEELGLERERVDVLDSIIHKSHGIFLATGPTGSGKTTTLYSILRRIYTPARKILTIEDPVEYELPGVAQIPVRPGRGFTFATALRAILRQDPDVIMVGEIRDTETAEIAIRAALTGHLVFSTLHTNDTAGAVARLVDMGVEPFLVASSLEGVLAQRLVRRICTHCRERDPAPEEMIRRLSAAGLAIPHGDYWRGRGCDECRGSGYRGRVGLFELLVIDSELEDLIATRRPTSEIRAAGAESRIDLAEDGVRKAASGETTLEEIFRVAIGGAVDGA